MKKISKKWILRQKSLPEIYPILGNIRGYPYKKDFPS